MPKIVEEEDSKLSFLFNEKACKTFTQGGKSDDIPKKILPKEPKNKYNTQNYFTEGINLGVIESQTKQPQKET